MSSNISAGSEYYHSYQSIPSATTTAGSNETSFDVAIDIFNSASGSDKAEAVRTEESKGCLGFACEWLNQKRTSQDGQEGPVRWKRLTLIGGSFVATVMAHSYAPSELITVPLGGVCAYMTQAEIYDCTTLKQVLFHLVTIGAGKGADNLIYGTPFSDLKNMVVTAVCFQLSMRTLMVAALKWTNVDAARFK